jgi:hypothetical protein
MILIVKGGNVRALEPSRTRVVVTDLPEIGTALRSIPNLNPKSRTAESSRS